MSMTAIRAVKQDAESFAGTDPEAVGLSTSRLGRLSAALQDGVDRGEIPGAIALIARDGRIAYQQCFGFRDREAKAPMQADAIFRIASMTKPIVSLAVMMLVEEGRIQIGYPASRWLPELADLKVAIEDRPTADAIGVAVEPMRREITVQDLLRHTSGLTYGFMGESPVHRLYMRRDPMNRNLTNAEAIARLAEIPLRFQPGTTWEYSVATDVLGRLVEVVSGQALDAFIAERITGPLGMTDTGFWVPDDKKHRLAQAQVVAATGKRPVMIDVDSKPKRLGGGGGLVSTTADYAQFCQMLLNGGELDGTRLISRKTLDWMTADHLNPEIVTSDAARERIKSMSPGSANGLGFGLGFGVRVAQGRNVLPGSVGDYFWAGSQGTCFWVDPKERLFAVFMMQAPEEREHYRILMRELVYQAVVD
jgi:CubicO group peptidase (beta-lactamase class C family)